MKTSENKVNITGQLRSVSCTKSKAGSDIAKFVCRYYTGNRQGKAYEDIQCVAVNHIARTVSKMPLKSMIRIQGKLKESGVVGVDRVFFVGGSPIQFEDAKAKMGVTPERELPW